MTTTPRRILLVDDEPNICKALRLALRREEYEIFIASEPAEAFLRLKSQPVDMVISDHLMPNMLGVEFLSLVRDRHPDVLRILLTGHADMATAIRAINEGQIYRFFTKPWDDETLKANLCIAFEEQDAAREQRRLLASARLHSEKRMGATTG